MHYNKSYYLIHIQYLGFRFHGWAKQPNVKTVHHMVDRTINYVLEEKKFKTLATSRTDAMVSANHSAFELFLDEPLEDMDTFLTDLNRFFPSDIKATKIEEVDNKVFNIINTSKMKKYLYLFSFDEKPHPFSASLVASFPHEKFDIELMKKGAKLFEGKHNFFQYCTKPSPETNTVREVLLSEINEDSPYTANFFPKNTYAFHIHGAGFMRNQIRLMMGQLIELGKGNVTIEEIKKSLINPGEKRVQYNAPASGLILNEVVFDM